MIKRQQKKLKNFIEQVAKKRNVDVEEYIQSDYSKRY